MRHLTGKSLIFGVVLGVMSLYEQTSGNSYPEVITSLGTIRGTEMTSYHHGKSFSAFRGIRYAQPPVGELRFKVSLSDLQASASSYICTYYLLHSATRASPAMERQF